MRAPRRGPMTSQQIVNAVDAANLGVWVPGADNSAYHERVRVFLADLGLDPVDWIRARVAVKLARWSSEDRRR